MVTLNKNSTIIKKLEALIKTILNKGVVGKLKYNASNEN